MKFPLPPPHFQSIPPTTDRDGVFLSFCIFGANGAGGLTAIFVGPRSSNGFLSGALEVIRAKNICTPHADYYVITRTVQSGAVEFNTGKGEKLGSSQAPITCSLVSLPFRC